ncbi:MAG: CRTAC1 family protein [Sandaracinaceae bacterium]|nr:CRTAC1 family protein [Sandaracinaceae bacterium]
MAPCRFVGAGGLVLAALACGCAAREAFDVDVCNRAGVCFPARAVPGPDAARADAAAGDAPSGDDAARLPVRAARDGVAFEDVTYDAGDLELVYSTRNNRWDSTDIFSGAVVMRDLDGDDYPDIVVGRTAETDPTHQGIRFLVNQGDGTFRDRTREAGLEYGGPVTGLAAADLDGDGRVDLYVGTDRAGDRLFRQVAPGRFEDVSERAGVRVEGRRTRSVGLLDYDLDGWLDVYVTAWDGAGPRGHYGGQDSWIAPNTLYRNRGDGTFEDVTARAGVDCFGRSTLGVATEDLDGDADPDLYVVNDLFDDCLYENLGDGTFREISRAASVGRHAINGMGIATGDVDGDGDLDVLVTDDERADASTGNAFYFNLGALRFESAAHEVGVEGLWSVGLSSAIYWGAGFRDFDGDGVLDLHIAQHETGPDLLFVWRGDRFERVAADRFEVLSDARGSAYADFDRDGFVDILVATRGDAPRLLRNVGGGGARWVRVRLAGPRGNRDGVGAHLTVRACGATMLRAVEGTTGYLSTSEPLVTVGLGACDGPVTVEVLFPGGAVASGSGRPGDDIVVAHPSR